MNSRHCGPRIYEINTWVWLDTLSRHCGESITLANIPPAIIDDLAQYELDAIWLMGVWHHSEAVRESALNYVHEYRHALPDITPEDVKGSAYAIGRYEVDERIGGREGLLRFREQIAQYGIKLVLDYVPNHVSVDHPMIQERPDYFVHGTEDLIAAEPGNFFRTTDITGREQIIAHGRDPYFSGWIDTAQLNAFSPGYREAALRTLLDMAALCDGVRCDMAMLMLNDVFERTWGWLGLRPMQEDFWTYIIPKVRYRYPDFVFIAETYWGLDYALHLQGFDYTYDKTLYDRMVQGDTDGLYAHLRAHPDFLQRNIRFIENHDEPRAVAAFGLDKSRPAAAMICTLPGAVLLHDGQFEGRTVKLPVQIKRQPDEKQNFLLKQYYLKLLQETDQPVYREGTWTLFERQPVHEDDDTWQPIIAYGWQHEDEFRLVFLNLVPHWAQAIIPLDAWADRLRRREWQLYDVLHDTYRFESGDAIVEKGLRVNLAGHHARIYAFTPRKQR